MMDLQKAISAIFDFTYTSTKVKVPSVGCVEVGKILHTGLYIEEVGKRTPAFAFSDMQRTQLNGSKNKFSRHVASGVKSFYAEMNDRWRIYSDDIAFESHEIGFIVARLNGLVFADPKRDVFGDALEVFRSKWAKREGGQFFTDQVVTHLAVKAVSFDPLAGDDLVDICAGTGGFLSAGLHHLKNQISERGGGGEAKLSEISARKLIGQEIDKTVAKMGNASIAARAGSASEGIISIGDSLDLSGYERRGSRIRPGTHKCLATNPPFGSRTPVRDESVLKRFELSRINGSSKDSLVYSHNKTRGRSPDVLFIEANVRLLEPGEGRLAMVCPYQLLSGPQAYYVRDWIIRNCRVLSVIDLPPETFQPHTGTKTSLLVVKRRKEPLFDRQSAKAERIFMATPKWIGHDRRGNAIYKKLPDGTLSTEKLSDFDEVEDALIRFYENPKVKLSGSECFSVSIKDVLKDDAIRLNAKAYRHFHGYNAVKPIVKPGKGWNVELLENLVEDVFYPGRFKRDYTERYDGAVPFLGGSDITGNIWETEKWLRHDDPKLDRLIVRKGWVLVTRSGTTGVVSMVPDEWDGFAMSEHVIRIIPSERVISGHYIYSYLSTPYCQQQIKSSVFGSVIDEINPSSLKKLEVPIPPKNMLKEIIASAKAGSQARSEAIAKQKSAVSSLSAILDSLF